MTTSVVWVTGAHGFIGRHVAYELAVSGHNVSGIGHGSWPPMEARKAGLSHWLNGDIATGNLATLSCLGGAPDVVVHLAGGSSVAGAISQPREDFNRTVTGTMELYEWLRLESPSTRVVAVSTAAVYGANAPGRISEGDPLKPFSPYGFHKLMMESVCDSYAASYGIRSVVLRLFSIYGAGLKKQLLWDLCTKLLVNPGRVDLGGSGAELRDWVAVSDVASIVSRVGVLASIEVPKINVGSGIGTPVHSVAARVVDAWHGRASSATEIIFNGESRPGDPFSLVASPDKATRLGLECRIPLLDGICAYVAWFKQLHG